MTPEERIKEAANDLLEALESVVEYSDSDRHDLMEEAVLRQKVTAAIAKARGTE